MQANNSMKWACAAVAIALIAGCNRPEAAHQMKMPPPSVTAVAAVTQDVPVYLDEIGKTVSMDYVAIVPQVAGKLTAAYVDDGADVKKGQLLFEIDPRPFQAALAQAKAALAEAKANLDLAKIQDKRVEALQGTEAISQQEIDEAKNGVEVNNAKVGAAQADLETAQLNLEYTKIYSPIDGRAGARLVVPGNIVKANDTTTPVMVIQRLDPIYAEFTVTENDLGTVRKFLAGHGLDMKDPEKGLKVEVDVPGNSQAVMEALHSVDNQLGPAPTTLPTSQPTAMQPTTQPAAQAMLQPGTQPTTEPTTQPKPHAGPREGTLTFLDNAVQESTGTVKVRATVPNSDHYFWPGQFVNCRLILTIKKNAVLVPTEAQQIGQQGPFVYVVDEKGNAAIHPIQPGQKQGNMIVVESGVQPGDKVITTGQMMVVPNMPVTVVNDQKTAVSMAH